MIRTQIQLEEDQMEWLKKEAAAKGTSISQLIRDGIDFFRASEESLPEDKKRKALAAVGLFTSDRTDVSEDHDRYLAQSIISEDSV